MAAFSAKNRNWHRFQVGTTARKLCAVKDPEDIHKCDVYVQIFRNFVMFRVWCKVDILLCEFGSLTQIRSIVISSRMKFRLIVG